MRTTILILLLCLSGVVSGQVLNWGYEPVGRWETNTKITKWETTDTINFCINCDTTWVYRDWSVWTNIDFDLVFHKEPYRHPIEKVRYRLNEQGINQVQWETTTYTFIPDPPTPYEQLMNKITKRK